MKNRPIGIFDSGLGGLTVARSIIDLLPDEHIIYLGDDARGPYGPREQGEVRAFAREIIDYLLGFGVKLVVIACNSATAAALEEAQRDYDIPVVGVILPGLRAALQRSTRRRIGVIGTRLTISSGTYERALGRLDPSADIVCQACPEFVELVENGEVKGTRAREITEGYIEPLAAEGIDTLILGCTHYPLLQELIQEVVGSGVTLISSADETAREVGDILERLGWKREAGSPGLHYFLTTGNVEKSARLGRMFLGPEVRDVIHVGFDLHPPLDFPDGGGKG